MHWVKFLGKQLSDAFTRFTLSRWHTAFFVVTFVHCAALVFLQSVSFIVNEEARDFMVHVMALTGARRDNLAIVATHPKNTLFLCNDVPGDGLSYRMSVDEIDATGACTQVSPILSAADTTKNTAVETVVPSPKVIGATSDSRASLYKQFAKRNVLYPDMTLVPDIQENTPVGLSIVGLGNSTGIVDLNGNLWISQDCVASLRFPNQEFTDVGRENVSFLFFHVWVLAISVLAIVNESIPHLASSLAGQCLATAWASWDIYRTLKFKRRYEELIADGVCSGAQLIPNYFVTRNRLNVSIACINLGALALTFWITISLIKMFSTSQFKSVGAAPVLDKLYRLLMAFSTTMRLWMFFLVLSTTLWLDQVGSGLLHTFLSVPQFRAYIGIGVIALIMVLPVVFLGDIGMRQERRGLVAGYLVGQTTFVVFQIYLLASTAVYRWTLIVWPFFAVNVAAGLFLCVCTLVLGIICRLNFGRGLDHFLHVTSVLERDGFTRGFMTPERTSSKKAHTPNGSWDQLLEAGETVKFAASYLQPGQQPPRVPQVGSRNTFKKNKRVKWRDSTESFGHTTFDPGDFDEKAEVRSAATSLEHTTTGDSLPEFDNRAAVRAPDAADRI